MCSSRYAITSGETATFSVAGVSGSSWCERISRGASRRDVENARQLRTRCRDPNRWVKPGQSTTAVDATLRTITRPFRSTIVLARRLDPVAAQLVLERGRFVLLGREDLQRPQPEEQHAEGDQRDAAENGHAHRHPRRQQVRLLDLRVGGRKLGSRSPVLAKSAHLLGPKGAAGRRGSSLRTTAKTGHAAGGSTRWTGTTCRRAPRARGPARRA